MEVGSRGFGASGNNEVEVDKSFNSEFKVFASQVVESLPAPASTDIGAEPVNKAGTNCDPEPVNKAGTDGDPEPVNKAGTGCEPEPVNKAGTGGEPVNNEEKLSAGAEIPPPFTFPPVVASDLNSFPPETTFPGFGKSVPLQEGLQSNVENDTANHSNEPDDAFDDMVVLKDGMVTSASASDGAADDAVDLCEVLDAQLQEATTFDTATGISEPVVVIPAGAVDVLSAVKDGSGIIEAASLAAESPQIAGPACNEHAGFSAGSSLLSEKASEGENEAEQPSVPAIGEQAQAEKPAAEGHVVTEEDIQAIKGQKVLKKFGKKNFSGEVTDYDPESKWFKVIYEDGDTEDLELWEVKAILASSVSQASVSKKRPRAEGETMQSTKKPKKTSAASSSKKKSLAKSPKTPKTQAKSSKKSSTTKKSKSTGKSAAKSPKTPQTKKGSKGKARVATQTPKGGKGATSKSAKVSRSVDLGSPKVQKGSSRKKASSDTPKTPNASGKRKADKDVMAASKTKRPRKEDVKGEEGAEEPSCVGRSVKKEFDGTLYDGSVVKYDKRRKYYKVKYSDGDEEDLVWSELEPILVADGSGVEADVDPAKEKEPTAPLMSQEKVEA